MHGDAPLLAVVPEEQRHLAPHEHRVVAEEMPGDDRTPGGYRADAVRGVEAVSWRVSVISIRPRTPQIPCGSSPPASRGQ